MNGVVAVRNARTVSKALADLGQRLYARGWVLGTSGNFSEVVSRRPLRLAITASGPEQAHPAVAQILAVDRDGKTAGPPAAGRRRRPLLHVEIVRARGAGAVLHTHSIWSTVLSDVHADAAASHPGLRDAEGPRGRDDARAPGVDSDPRERSGHARGCAARSGANAPSTIRRRTPFLLRRHGMYTWGETLAEAERHVEILEFLLRDAVRRSRYDVGNV